MNVRNVDIFSDEEVKTHVHLLRHRVDESKLSLEPITREEDQIDMQTKAPLFLGERGSLLAVSLYARLTAGATLRALVVAFSLGMFCVEPAGLLVDGNAAQRRKSPERSLRITQ